MSISDILMQRLNNIEIRYIAIFLLISSVVINIAFVLATTDKLLDFGSFIAAGKNVSAGINPYDDHSPLIFQTEYTELGIGGKLPNLNPPISILFFIPLSHVNPLIAVTTWRIISIGLYVLTIVFLWKFIATNKSHLMILWGFSLAGFWHTIQLGQIYTVLFLALALTFVFEKRGYYLAAGILAGFIVAIKPNFLIWIFLLAASRNWKITIPAIASYLALSAIPTIVFGPEIYLHWFSASSLDGRILGLPGNNSLSGLTTRMGFTEIGFYLGSLLVVTYGILIFKKEVCLKITWFTNLGSYLLCSAPLSVGLDIQFY